MRRDRVFVLLIVASAVAALGPAATTGATPAVAESRTGPLAATANFASDGYATNAGENRMSTNEVMAHWTPERMAAATPARPPAKPSIAATTPVSRDAKPMLTEPRSPSPEALAQAARSIDAAATITAGRVYFIDPVDGKEHFCSGATVNSVKRRLVLTAGHCVVNIFWMQGLIFAPGYDNGAPFGFWAALGLAARTDWIFSALPGADLGVAIMDNDPSGRLIVDVVGGNGLAWNWPPVSRVDAFSYPNAQPTQLACAGPNVPGIDAGTVGMTPCPGARNKGASGGPMLIFYGSLGAGVGYANSVIANFFTPAPFDVYGPYFENVNAGLLYYAESISP